MDVGLAVGLAEGKADGFGETGVGLAVGFVEKDKRHRVLIF